MLVLSFCERVTLFFALLDFLSPSASPESLMRASSASWRRRCCVVLPLLLRLRDDARTAVVTEFFDGLRNARNARED